MKASVATTEALASQRSRLVVKAYLQATIFIKITLFSQYLCGRDKSFEQIADLPHSYILADGIEHPIGKKLPLWIVELLY